MERSSKRDITADTAVGDISGEALLVEVFSRIPAAQDRALLLAHVALGVSLASLEDALGTRRQELATRIKAMLGKLQQDAELMSALGGTGRAGRAEHYLDMITLLDLQDWFCAYCKKFMIQPPTGRHRKTCSDLCRHRLWRDRHQADPKNSPLD